MRRWTVLVAVLGAFLFAAFAASAARAANAPQRWSPGYTLVILEPGAEPRRALDRVQEAGGSIAVVVPPRVLMGWIPPALDAALVGRDGIRSLHRSPLTAVPADLTDRMSRAAVATFARAVRGELDPERLTSTEAAPGAPGRFADAFDPGVIPAADVQENLRRVGHANATKVLPNGELAGTSDYMNGTVAVTIFFVESDGTGADPNLYSWTPAAEQQIIDEAVAGLTFWSQQSQAFNCWVAFYVHGLFATQDPRLRQWREPVTHSSDDYASAIQAVLGNFGYTAGNALSRAAAFNAVQRTNYGTNWAYSAFVAPNSTGPTAFTNGYSAWAYLGGPYTALLQRSFSWPFGQVFTHESGHIFRACDEYYQAGYGGCTDCGNCGTGVANGNCEFCNPSSVGCMMKANSWVLCYWTPGQIGWWQSPCAPVPLPPPVLSAVAPTAMDQSATGSVTLTGSSFQFGTHVEFGPGVTVNSTVVNSSTSITAQLTVDLDAAAGLRDVLVRSPDLQSDVLPAAFNVRSTPRHYVSATGGNVPPYITPATAGANLAAVLAACSENDSVFLAGGSYLPATLAKTLTLLGGWRSDFGARDPAAWPTILQGTGTGPALQVIGTGKHPVIDGLVMRGGSGSVMTAPGVGSGLAGGGLLCFEAGPVLRNCTIENNATAVPGNPGLGGGAFFWSSTAVLDHCTVRNNQATRGAGVLCVQSHVQFRDNLIENNACDTGNGTARGAGVAGYDSELDFLNDVIRANTGAASGGGLHLENCAHATLIGVLIADHAVTGTGGGITAESTPLILQASVVRQNTSGSEGAGLYCTGAPLTMEAAVVAGNTAGALGGGIRAHACTSVLRNVTVAANSGSFASGVYSTATGPGSVVDGCVIASNVLGGLVYLAPAPAVDWNAVWSNGGLDYLGASPGPHDLAVDPRFVDLTNRDVHLGAHSGAIDSGDPQPSRRDPDGSRNDRGGYGGPLAPPDAPERVTGLHASRTGNTVRVAWQASAAPDVTQYLVYRNADAANVPSFANWVGTVSNPDSAWTDTAPLANGWYTVGAVDAQNNAGGYADPVAPAAVTDAPVPATLALRASAANPVAGTAWIEFDLPAPAHVQIAVYAVNGRRVARVATGEFGAGSYRLPWNGRDGDGRPVAAGVFVVHLTAGARTLAQKLVVVR